MRVFIALVIIIYLIGVGVTLAPTFQAKWSTATAAELTASIGEALPGAFAWPVTAYHSLTGTSQARAPSP
jgi:hypothetical protein